MGNLSSRVVHRVTRPVRDFNIDERTHKAALKSADKIAPKHPTTVTHIANAIQNIPEDVRKSLHESDLKLDERLKKVFVTSVDHNPSIPRETPGRPLPTHRNGHVVPEFGYHEPSTVPFGKITLRSALTFISKHQEDADTHNASSIAQQYKIDETAASNILKHFGTFRLVIPSKLSPRQVDLLAKIQATSSSIPATPEVRSLLGGIPITSRKSAHKNYQDSIPFETTTGESKTYKLLQKQIDEEKKVLQWDNDVPSQKGVADMGTSHIVEKHSREVGATAGAKLSQEQGTEDQSVEQDLKETDKGPFKVVSRSPRKRNYGDGSSKQEES